jgi:hypothetical protein
MKTNKILKPMWLLVAVIAMAAATAGVDASPQASDHPTGVIPGIPSCATGREGSGALLRYRLTIDDPSRPREGESVTVTLVFTISDDM